MDAVARAHDAQSARDRSVRTRGPRRARSLSCEDDRARPQYCVATADVSGHLIGPGTCQITCSSTKDALVGRPSETRPRSDGTRSRSDARHSPSHLLGRSERPHRRNLAKADSVEHRTKACTSRGIGPIVQHESAPPAQYRAGALTATTEYDLIEYAGFPAKCCVFDNTLRRN